MLLTGSADRVLTADDVTATALLNCLVREVCAPEDQVWQEGPHLVIRLPRVGVRLRTRLTRPPVAFTYRLTTPVEELRDEWIPVSWARLADLIAGELELSTGEANPEFLGQVRESHSALSALLAFPSEPSVGFVASEQSLVAGHRFHPSPKARQGSPSEWLRYAPEAGSRFPLRWLAIRSELIAEDGDLAALESLGPAVPDGYRLLPVHPWQLSLLSSRPVLGQALDERAVIDLGDAGPDVIPTSSVRTVYLPGPDLFCKFSLDVRITNCIRKNAWYELAGAVALSRLLKPIFEEMDGCRLLAEPAYRSVNLADRRLHEGLGVILREGLGTTGGTPLLAAALADPYRTALAALGAATPEGALAWWSAYVHHVARPVLYAYLAHGVVLEPHLQNVLVVMDKDGMPAQAIFRDLEGTKLVAGRWDPELAELPPRIREALTYDADRGWDRVVYCLFVNHLAEIAAALADLHPGLEQELWRIVRQCISTYDGGARLRALLAGVPLPAKANLRARWARSADRTATYVMVPSPLREASR